MSSDDQTTAPVERHTPGTEREGGRRGALRPFGGDLDVYDGDTAGHADEPRQHPAGRSTTDRSISSVPPPSDAAVATDDLAAPDLHDDPDDPASINLPTAGEPRRPQSNALSSSAEFTEERALHRERPGPQGGWRRLVHLVTGGLVKLGPSTRDIRWAERMEAVRTPIAGSRRVVVAARKGGVGKTTTTLMLGHTFATERGDRVVAMDGDPDSGSLGYRVRRETTATIQTLLDRRDDVERYANIRGYTSQAPTRLEVLASHDDPAAYDALGYADYQTAIRLLDRHYNLILVDGGTGVLSGGAKGTLGTADQLIVVMASTLDSVRSAGLMLDWLEAHGYGPLVSGSVAVVNRAKPRTAVRSEVIDEHFGRRCRAVVTIPDDPALEPGAQSTLEQLRPATRDAYLDLAAAVAESFGAVGPRVDDEGEQ